MKLDKMSGLDSILWELRDKSYIGSNPYELFSQFCEVDGQKVENWVSQLFEQTHCAKCDSESDIIRQEGNKFYIKGEWIKSLQYYTKALSKAHPKSRAYAMALANRSAALYSMKEYQCCLQDISSSLTSNYPSELKYKIFIRKINCYDKLGMKKEAESSLEEGLVCVKSNTNFTEQEKETCVNKLLRVERLLPDDEVMSNCKCEIPNLIDDNKFLEASSSVGLRCSTEKGRYVIAEEDISRGDVLFVEKAFAFAPIFNEEFELLTDRCYQCLLYNKILIPCPYCSVSLYCDDDCRTKSWNDIHKWECKGMSVNLWSAVSLGFPALRVLLKIISSTDLGVNQNDLNISQSKNYKLVLELVSNISRNENISEFLVLTAVMVYYFETQTDFFKWFGDQVNMVNDKHLKIYFGSLLLKHIAQIACNASVIEHWEINNYKYMPSEKVSVAAGLYPSVSMMNHSCKPNISLYYINDVVIVKATDYIKKNEEICNCYGIDYRYAGKKERRKALQLQYQFQCSCKICENPKLELDYMDSYKCPYCSGTICMEQQTCYECAKIIDTSAILHLQKKTEQYLQREVLCLEDIDKCYNLMKDIYNGYHVKLAECCDKYKTYYLLIGKFEQAVDYFIKSLEIKNKRWGESSLNIAKEILEFLDQLKTYRIKDRKGLLTKLGSLYQDIENILPLYYPDEYINYVELKKLIQ